MSFCKVGKLYEFVGLHGKRDWSASGSLAFGPYVNVLLHASTLVVFLDYDPVTATVKLLLPDGRTWEGPGCYNPESYLKEPKP